MAEIIGKAVRDGKQCYYINDGVYHTFSGVIFDHIQYHFKAFKQRRRRRSAPSSARPATRSTRSRWPRICRDLELGDLVYSENVGAYTHASSTYFNGFPPAKVVHVNR